jgi:hypothetical protein
MKTSASSSELVSTQTGEAPQLPNRKVKIKKPRQRACNETNDKWVYKDRGFSRWEFRRAITQT